MEWLAFSKKDDHSFFLEFDARKVYKRFVLKIEKAHREKSHLESNRGLYEQTHRETTKRSKHAAEHS